MAVNRKIFLSSFANLVIFILWGLSFIFRIPFLAYSAMMIACFNLVVTISFYRDACKNKGTLQNFNRLKFRFFKLIIPMILYILIAVLYIKGII
jgi:Ca2+/Na+ antiporter